MTGRRFGACTWMLWFIAGLCFDKKMERLTDDGWLLVLSNKIELYRYCFARSCESVLNIYISHATLG